MSVSETIRPILAVVLWTMVACGGAFVWLFQDAPLLNRSVLASRTPMDPARIAPDEGRAFLYPSRWFGFGDDVDRPRSGIVLYEDGIELAPSRAKHDLVRGSGGGAWSHWKTSIFFSSSDGSDPRTNGRRYEIQGLTLPIRWGSMILTVIAALMALLAVARLARRAPPARTEPTDRRDAPSSPAAVAARRPPGRRLALTAAAVAVSLLLVMMLLGVLEVILRLGAAGGPPSTLRLAPEIGWERAGAAVRPIPAGAADDRSALRILFTGDSFTHDKTWGDKTISALRARGIPAVGFEAGVSGYGTTQTFMQLQRLLPDLDPDVVVILFYGWNDLRDNWPYPAICYNPRMTLRPYMDEEGAIQVPSSLAIGLKQLELWKQVIEPALHPIRAESANDAVASLGVDRLAASRRRVVIGYDAESSWRPFYERSHQDGPYVQGAWTVTARTFEAIRDLCKAHGAALIVVGIDNPMTVDQDVADRWLRAGGAVADSSGATPSNQFGGERHRDAATPRSADDVDPDLPMRRLAEVLNELGIAFVDAVPPLRARRDRLGGAKQFDGDPGNISAHLLPEAEEALADSITPLLVDVAGRVQRRR